MNKFASFILFIFFFISVKAEIKLPAMVGNDMVLQRDKPIKLWGYGQPDETVSIEFAGKAAKTTAKANGKWTLTIPALKAGGPYIMTLKGENKIVLSNILIGDVWICSGQSNMEFNLQDVLNAAHEVKHANYPEIRLYSVEKRIALKPDENSRGTWSICSPEHAKYFPAIGYFFGRRINTDTKIPIGLINSSWGGTVIESWISAEGLKDEPTFGEKAQQVSRFDTAAYNRKQRALNQKWVENFNRQDAGFKNGDYQWAKTDYSLWSTINLPTGWEFTGKPDLWELDGIVWFVKEVELTDDDLKDDAQLNLGVILNADQAFVNGEMVGKTGDSWGKTRSYTLPKSLLKRGKNTIIVRIENYGGDGGFTGKADFFNIKTSSKITSLAGEWRYKIGFKLNEYNRPEKEIGPNTLPTLMYNNLISPITGFSIKGVLWYQGESNWDRAYQYRELFHRMIADWRKQFNDNNFPFLYVQLANFHKKTNQPGNSNWAEVREAQSITQSVKNTGMITAIDVGDSANIHPKNKQELGRRLALLAEQKVYRLPVDSVSAAFAGFKQKGSAIVITFNHVYTGLKTTFAEPGNFQIAAENQVWYWAKAQIIGFNTIKVYSDKVARPVAVRYAWEDNPANANVINSKGFPLLPFRTDDWKGVTFGKM